MIDFSVYYDSIFYTGWAILFFGSILLLLSYKFFDSKFWLWFILKSFFVIAALCFAFTAIENNKEIPIITSAYLSVAMLFFIYSVDTVRLRKEVKKESVTKSSQISINWDWLCLIFSKKSSISIDLFLVIKMIDNTYIGRKVVVSGYEYCDAEIIGITDNSSDPEFSITIEDEPDSNPHTKSKNITVRRRLSDIKLLTNTPYIF